MYYDEADYIDMFQSLGFNIPKGHKGLVSCPHHTDKHPSMSVDLRRGIFNCFACNWHGSISKEYYNTFGHAYNKQEEFSINELRNIFKSREKPKIINTKNNIFKAEYDKYNSKILDNWLSYRGINKDVAKKSGVFYGSVKIKYLDDEGNPKSYTVHDRIIFPIYNKDNKLSSLEMRFPFFGTESKAFKESVKKVLYPKCSTVNFLYEQNTLNKNQRLYVLEGLMDCLAFRSLTGIKNSTSIFGAMLTNYQKEVLNTFPEICYVYNNDVAGINSVNTMKKSYKGKFLTLKPAGNFDDVGEMAMANYKDIDKWLKTIA